jgi:hypothetical protein
VDNHRSRALPIHLGAKTSETQIVIAIRADLAAVPKPRGMFSASKADVALEPELTPQWLLARRSLN